MSILNTFFKLVFWI